METNNFLVKNIFSLLLIVLFLLTGITEIEAQGNSDIRGIWEGVLQIKLIWKIDRDAQGNLISSLNIPDQKSYNIPVQNVVFKGDSLFLEINISNSQKSNYTGKYNKEKNFIEGYYSDCTNKYPMTVTASTKLVG